MPRNRRYLVTKPDVEALLLFHTMQVQNMSTVNMAGVMAGSLGISLVVLRGVSS